MPHEGIPAPTPYNPGTSSLTMTDTKTTYRTRDLPTAESKTSYGSNQMRSPAPEPEPEPKSKLIDLSPTQLTGGALAAMTSAVVGARLGVAGTVLGAAVGSVVAGVAGTLYTTSLRRTKDKISAVIDSKTGDTEIEVVSAAAEPGRILDQDTAIRPAIDDAQTLQLPAAAGYAVRPAAAVDAPGTRQTRHRLPWKAILVSTAAVFVLAFAAITGFEVLTGHAISGGQGTTITQVSEGRSSGSDVPSKAPSTAASSQTSAEPTSSATSEPTSEPTTEAPATAEPTQSPVPSATTNSSTDGRVGAAAADGGTGTSGAGASSR